MSCVAREAPECALLSPPCLTLCRLQVQPGVSGSGSTKTGSRLLLFNPDPDPDQCFYEKELFFGLKSVIYVILNLHKGHSGSRRSLQPNGELFEHEINLFIFSGTVLAGLVDSIRIRIPCPDPDPSTHLNPVTKHWLQPLNLNIISVTDPDSLCLVLLNLKTYRS